MEDIVVIVSHDTHFERDMVIYFSNPSFILNYVATRRRDASAGYIKSVIFYEKTLLRF